MAASFQEADMNPLPNIAGRSSCKNYAILYCYILCRKPDNAEAPKATYIFLQVWH